jgi:hypothetical protein
MLELKNLQGQVLLTLADGDILNNQGQTIARAIGRSLLNLRGQILAEIENGNVFRQRGVTLIRTEGSQIVNLSGQHLATVEAGSQDETALLGAAFLVFLQ